MSEGELPLAARDHHAARWHEPIIMELGRPGQRGIHVPPVEEEIAAAVGRVEVPEPVRRRAPPALPELSQPEVLRHYLRLSQEVHSVDLAVAIGEGTCTVKYNPRVNERLARLPQIADLHPLQDEETVQGILEIMYRLGRFLCAISGMEEFSFQPGGGAHGVYTNASIIRAYHAARGEAGRRDEIITTVFSHPCNAGCAATAGFKVITLMPEETGYPSVEALKAALSERTAGLMITNPEDTGLYNPHVAEFTRLVHEAGGLCAYDQANGNVLLGIARAAEAGFDLCQFNLHKTFGTPHSAIGQACGAVGVRRELARFLPVPVVGCRDGRYFLDYDRPESIGRVRQFHGNAQTVLRAYAWIRALGAEGLRRVAETAALNNSYLVKQITAIPGVALPYGEGKVRLDQARYSWEPLTRETGVGTEDIRRRMVDYGVVNYFTSHEPWLVPEPFTLEPTETPTREDLDTFAAVLRAIAEEAYANPELVRSAPHRSTISQIDHDAIDDPKRWAMTWRAYRAKGLDYG